MAVTEGPRFRTPEDPEEDTSAPSPRQSTVASSRRGPRIIVSGGSGCDGRGATLGSRTVSGLWGACACAGRAGRVVDPGRAGTRGALLPSSNLWPELGSRRTRLGGGRHGQREPGRAAGPMEPRKEPATNVTPLEPGSPEHLSVLRGFLGGLQPLAESFASEDLLESQDLIFWKNLARSRHFCAGVDSGLIHSFLSSPYTGPERVLLSENKALKLGFEE